MTNGDVDDVDDDNADDDDDDDDDDDAGEIPQTKLVMAHKNASTAKQSKAEEPNKYAKGKGKRRDTTSDHGRPRGTREATGGNGRQREATEVSSCAQILLQKLK